MAEASTALILHKGAIEVSRSDLHRAITPEGTKSWFPVAHHVVIDTVEQKIAQAGYQIKQSRYALARDDQRMFATLDLTAPLAHGSSLAVGIRNSTDKSFPLGFAAGSRVFVCDNLAFRSELMVSRKHTRFGEVRFVEAITLAVQSLACFQSSEAGRIKQMMETLLTDDMALAWMVRGMERGVISSRRLPELLKEWREPSYPEFEPRTVWSLYNAFTAVLTAKRNSDPQGYAATTIELSAMLDGFAPLPLPDGIDPDLIIDVEPILAIAPPPSPVEAISA